MDRTEQGTKRGTGVKTLRIVSSSWIFHLFLSVLIIAVVFLWPPSVFKGDTDTARNYLNTIVSSLSTILALCISIILVAIQLTASNYTHRVLDFFVRLPYNASLFTFYLVTIMHSFFLMAKIKDPVKEQLPRPLQPEMSADLVLVVICFLSLLVYMYAVIQLLKPDRIINLILREYDRSCAKGLWRTAVENVEQICDIAKRAASVSDSVTGTRCVEAMSNIVARLPLPADREDPMLAVHQSALDQWVEIVGVSVKEKDTGLLYSVLNALYAQGVVYIGNKVWPAAELVIKAYRHLVFSHLLSEGQIFYVERVADKLYRLAHAAAEQDERGRAFCLRTWQIIRAIGESAFAAQPASVASLMEGFLMPRELPLTFEHFTLQSEQLSGTVVYFELWKSFVPYAAMRDAARWATWWNERIATKSLASNGVTLSVLIALHMKRQEIAQTLCYMWDIEMGEVDTAAMRSDFSQNRAELFDGWPLRTIGNR